MALSVPVIRTPTSPLLRLPAELRLRIAIEVVVDGPEPSHAPSYRCLEGFTVDFLRKQYALFKIPSFASLAHQYPHAFTQNEAVVLVRKLDDARAHYRGHPHSSTKVQQMRLPSNHYICSGVSVLEPMRSIVEAIKQSVCLQEPDESHESIGMAIHIPSPAIADSKTVKLITNELESLSFILMVRELVESRRLSTFKKLKLCVLVQRERVRRADEGFFNLLSRDERRRERGVCSVIRLLMFMPNEGQELEEVEVEVHDQRGKGREQGVICVEFRKAMNRTGQLEWTYEGTFVVQFIRERREEALRASAEYRRSATIAFALALLVVLSRLFLCLIKS